MEVEHNLTVPVSTDKGLCGGINSTVSKYARGTIATFDGGEALACHALHAIILTAKMPLLTALIRRAEGQQNDMIVLGEKGRAQLSRDRAKYIKETIADTQKVRITFSQVSILALDRCAIAPEALTLSLSREAASASEACSVGYHDACLRCLSP